MRAWPRALRRWQKELQIFPPEQSTLLGEMIVRLEPALASAARLEHEPTGEPDGYDGLSRSGPFERLLGSEWALQAAAPLEFLRRATQGELSFLNPIQRTPAARRSTLVLVDSGPRQLGGCRIVQLAILLALSERARRSGSAFTWQALVRTGEPPLCTLDEQSVYAFLAARTATQIGQSAIEDWLGRYPDAETWIVGDPGLRAFVPPRVCWVGVAELMDPEREAVQVLIEGSQQRRRQLTLELPEPALAKRLIRNPFELPARLALTPSARPESNLLLTPDGNHAMFVNTQGQACSVNLGRLQQGRPALRSFECEMRVVAMSHRGRRTCWLGASSGMAVLHATETLRRDQADTLTCPAPSVEPSQELWPLITFTSPLAALLVAGDRSLWRLNFETQKPQLLAEGVSALVPAGNNHAVATVARYLGKPAVIEVNSMGIKKLPFQYQGGAAFLRAQGNAHIVVASERPVGGYQIESKQLANEQTALYALSPPADHRVLGVDAGGRAWLDCALYILSPNGRTLEVIGRNRSRVVLSAATPLLSVAVAASAGRFAYMTAAGVFGVASREGRGNFVQQLDALPLESTP